MPLDIYAKYLGWQFQGGDVDVAQTAWGSLRGRFLQDETCLEALYNPQTSLNDLNDMLSRTMTKAHKHRSGKQKMSTLRSKIEHAQRFLKTLYTFRDTYAVFKSGKQLGIRLQMGVTPDILLDPVHHFVSVIPGYVATVSSRMSMQERWKLPPSDARHPEG